MRRDPTLQRLVVAGNLMAERLRRTADELDRLAGPVPDRPERRLAELWDQALERMRQEGRLNS
ncbi:MAG: hypothetical protein GWN84_02250 [Gammaproteobacteria bacterium]|nr:hypothetical protein [Gammaproteobacteria bacterium]NIR81969.1 hypothetical protein [Gammaproteobacteria bacterium]NIR89021.1 hypothetical protein [Gammaproteobacteria bacterium]NIU03076.1 hypothetical protein [Gammaproteobacteria bacterium]NIV50600.1 hypothetical protein [Gammaproteobacteria bacterium]